MVRVSGVIGLSTVDGAMEGYSKLQANMILQMQAKLMENQAKLVESQGQMQAQLVECQAKLVDSHRPGCQNAKGRVGPGDADPAWPT